MHKIDNASTNMTPREIVAGARPPHRRPARRQARGRDRAAQPLAAHAAAPELRNEVMPKNILMIGPTGVGKTEIARRLATLANAPFVKVEATALHRGRLRRQGRRADHPRPRRHRGQAVSRAGQAARAHAGRGPRRGPHPRCAAAASARPRPRSAFERDHHRRHRCGAVVAGIDRPQKLRKQLRAGELDEREIELDLAANVGVDIMTPPGMEEMGQQLRQMFGQLAGGKTHKRTITIKAARPLLIEEEAGKLVNEDEVREGDRGLRAARHRLHRRDRQGRQAQRRRGAPMSAAKACSATCCRWSRAPRSAPSTAR
jgi:ATP-dependent HslUV protease ATP-binding subunit HslU